MSLPSVGLKGIPLAEERGFIDLAPLSPCLYQWHILATLLAGMRGTARDQALKAIYPNFKS